MPEGSRWLDKVQCEKCTGAGFAVSSAEKVCPQCEGLGFVESDEDGLVLCPDCSGERKVDQRIEVTCDDCKGRGFHPRIMQRFEATIECATCKGVGEIEVIATEEREEECAECEGSGRRRHVEYCSLPKWSVCPVNSKRGRKIVWTEDDIGVEIEVDSGAFVEIVSCEACTPLAAPDESSDSIPSKHLFLVGCGIDPIYRSDMVYDRDENDEDNKDEGEEILDEGEEILDEDEEIVDEGEEILDEGEETDKGEESDEDDGGFWNQPCSVCEGLHRVVQISKPCIDCRGFGWVEVEEEECNIEECPDCEGSGEMVISETREV